MSLDNKNLNSAAVAGQVAPRNTSPTTQSSSAKKSSSSTDTKLTNDPNNKYAQRVTRDVSTNYGAIAASTYTGGPKFNPYLFPYMPSPMQMPSISTPNTSSPKVASTDGSRNRREYDDEGGGSVRPHRPKINNEEGFEGQGAIRPEPGSNSPFKAKPLDKKEEAKEEKNSNTKETKKNIEEVSKDKVEDSPEIKKEKPTASLDIGFGEFV